MGELMRVEISRCRCCEACQDLMAEVGGLYASGAAVVLLEKLVGRPLRAGEVLAVTVRPAVSIAEVMAGGSGEAAHA